VAVALRCGIDFRRERDRPGLDLEETVGIEIEHGQHSPWPFIAARLMNIASSSRRKPQFETGHGAGEKS
jgi:hypothetical protein